MRKEINSIKDIFNEDKPKGRIFAFFIQFFIILSLISFAYETLPGLSLIELKILYLIEIVSVTLFTVDYLGQIFTSHKKIKYIFSFSGIVDLLSVLPFYLSLGLLDSRSLKILRIFRLFKLLKYNKAMDRFIVATRSIKAELILFSFITLLILYVASVGIYYFEHDTQPEHFKSIIHSFWWSIVTLTTVGYGDVYPVTTGGRMFTFVLLMLGLAVVSIPAGLLASALNQNK